MQFIKLLNYYCRFRVFHKNQLSQNVLTQFDSTVPSRPILNDIESTEYTIEIDWSLVGSAEKVFLEIFPQEGNCIGGCIVDVKTKRLVLGWIMEKFLPVYSKNLRFELS